MSEAGGKARQTLEELGIRDDAGVEALVKELRVALDAELATGESPQAAEQLRVRWLGRKQGLLGAANDHWLKTAPGPLKRTVGRLLNELRSHAEQTIEERQRAAANKAAVSVPAAAVDVTLPRSEERRVGKECRL